MDYRISREQAREVQAVARESDGPTFWSFLVEMTGELACRSEPGGEAQDAFWSDLLDVIETVRNEDGTTNWEHAQRNIVWELERMQSPEGVPVGGFSRIVARQLIVEYKAQQRRKEAGK